MTQKHIGQALLGEPDGGKPTRHRGTKGRRRLATLPSWQRPCVAACEEDLPSEGSLAATTHHKQSQLGVASAHQRHNDRRQQPMARDRVGIAASIGPPPGLECPESGIGEARADLEAAIRKLLASPTNTQEPCASQLQESPLVTGGLSAEASAPNGSAVPMLKPMNVTDSRPDDTIAELLLLRSRLADRLSGGNRPPATTAMPSAVQALMACSAAASGKDKTGVLPFSLFRAAAWPHELPALDEPWHVY